MILPSEKEWLIQAIKNIHHYIPISSHINYRPGKLVVYGYDLHR